MNIKTTVLLASLAATITCGQTNIFNISLEILRVSDHITVTSACHYVAGIVQPPEITNADVIVVLHNGGSQDIIVFDAWNSLGYCNLKFVFYSGGHEFWVTKKPGYWRSNFPSYVIIPPGGEVKMPVAFSVSTWNGLDDVFTNRHLVSEIRAVYEQHHVIEKTFLATPRAWDGIVSSVYYPAANLLPQFSFASIVNTGINQSTNADVNITIK